MDALSHHLVAASFDQNHHVLIGGFRSAAVPAAVVGASRPHFDIKTARARRPRDSRRDAGATKTAHFRAAVQSQTVRIEIDPKSSLDICELRWGADLYSRPRTLEEAVHVLTRQGGQILSGGTDFFPALGDRPAPDRVVDISGLTEIKGITIEPNCIRLGGLTTWSEVVAAPLPRCFDALKSAAREIGGIQIQNRGTIAGNLCNASPAADGVPPLLALDAEVELVSSLREATHGSG